MPQLNSREKVAFTTIMMAAAAFLVGAVRIWGVSADRLLGYLGLILIMVIAIIGLAAIVVTLRKLLSRRDRD